MLKQRKPIQLTNLIDKIKKCLVLQQYSHTKHALQRQKERSIELKDVIYVLKTGHHEKRKTTFDEANQVWKYAIRGKTVDSVDIRIVVAFDRDDMIIITVMEVL